MSLDYEAEYNARARVREHPAIIEGWARDAAAYRAVAPPREIAYGPGERRRIDLFEAGPGPAAMFVHGGYWQAMSRDFFSHMARGLNAHGIGVGVVGYELCPDVRVGDIVEQVRAACAALHRETAAPLVLSGHSAGGHLSACMLATEAHVAAAYAISGLFDLAPLLHTGINAKLGMSAAEARELSPLFWPAPEGKSLDAAVGGDESGEFKRQSRSIVAVWGEAGTATRYEEIAGANHFTVIAGLADPHSAAVARMKQLIAEAA